MELIKAPRLSGYRISLTIGEVFFVIKLFVAGALIAYSLGKAARKN